MVDKFEKHLIEVQTTFLSCLPAKVVDILGGFRRATRLSWTRFCNHNWNRACEQTWRIKLKFCNFFCSVARNIVGVDTRCGLVELISYRVLCSFLQWNFDIKWCQFLIPDSGKCKVFDARSRQCTDIVRTGKFTRRVNQRGNSFIRKKYIMKMVDWFTNGVLFDIFDRQALVEIERLRRSVSRGARSPSPSRAASAVLSRVEAERDHVVGDLRWSQNQIENLQDKLKVRHGFLIASGLRDPGHQEGKGEERERVEGRRGEGGGQPGKWFSSLKMSRRPGPRGCCHSCHGHFIIKNIFLSSTGSKRKQWIRKTTIRRQNG